MKGHGAKLPRRQEAAIAALLTEPTLAAAADRCGIGAATIWRWLQNPQFEVAYRAARREVVNAAVGQLQQAAAEAVACLRKNLASGQPAVEVRAAAVILEQVLGALDRLDLEERLRRLEALPQVENGPTA